MGETLSIKSLAERLYQRDIARDGDETKLVSRVSHGPLPEIPRETGVRQSLTAAGGESAALTVVSSAPEHQAHPWYTAEAAWYALARDTGLSPADLEGDWPASAWRRLYAARQEFWQTPRRDTRDGDVTRYENHASLAYSDIANRWRAKHWRKPPLRVCAGCTEQLGDSQILELGGYAVHQGREPDCLVRHSQQWRREAQAALKGFGIEAPPEWEP